MSFWVGVALVGVALVGVSGPFAFAFERLSSASVLVLSARRAFFVAGKGSFGEVAPRKVWFLLGGMLAAIRLLFYVCLVFTYLSWNESQKFGTAEATRQRR